ncbi:hypothetical protein Pan241w_01270 [Gimesia alba]|uniref:Uncharacterized protein n=1 Tax=Gimesia alba TaxID=2527973 RepID=A0A517R840_9PLAN|nr:SitI3 family protein [Gimesia alba]QDT40074.1 hypothetical protein Pan241w_01270 [Gimesia alba]
MSLDYSFALDTEDHPEDLLRWLESTFQMKRYANQRGTCADVGLQCTVLLQNTTSRDLIDRIYGIDTRIHILCRIDKGEAQSVGMDKLVELCLGLLCRDSADLLLLSNGEQGHVLRTHQDIYADCSDEYWEQKWNAAFGKARIEFRHDSLPCL